MNPLPQHEVKRAEPILPLPQTSPSNDIEVQIAHLLDSDGENWTDLVGTLHPLIMKLCAYRISKHNPHGDDICRDVATATLERLRKNNFSALRKYQQGIEKYACPFQSWLRVVVSNVHTDVLRSLPDNQRLRVDGARKLIQREMLPLTQEPSRDSEIIQRVEVSRILAWVSDSSFPDMQRKAIALWLRGYDESDIAQTLELSDRKEATRLLRAARQRLRRHFEDSHVY